PLLIVGVPAITQWYASPVVLGTFGSGSLKVTPVAVPTPVALELLKLMVKPIVVPVETGAWWSAVLFRLSSGAITRSDAVAVSGQALSLVQASEAVLE